MAHECRAKGLVSTEGRVDLNPPSLDSVYPRSMLVEILLQIQAIPPHP